MTKTIVALCALAAAFASGTASASQRISQDCNNDKPCISAYEALKKHRVLVQYTGSGKKYDYYKFVIKPHGGGDGQEIQVKGGKKGEKKLDLKKAGEYEIRIVGCQKAGGKPDPKQDTCVTATDKIRVNVS